MSDERLRELERRYRETGTVDDEAAYLKERARTGDLPTWKLNLAAYCDHPAAQAATGLRFEEAWDNPFRNWVYVIDRDCGSEPVHLIAALVAEALIPTWEADHADDPRPRLAVEATWRRLAAPDARHDGASMAAAQDAERAAADAPGLTGSKRSAWPALAARNAALRDYEGVPVHIGLSFAQAASLCGKETIVERLKGELLPWALGTHDPIAARVPPPG